MKNIQTTKVLVGGCFDILHYGHITFLKKARKLGDYLVVALESDLNIKKIKGKKRPIHTQIQRKEILESLRFVDKVIILKNKMTDKDYLDLVKRIKPTIIAVTKDDPKIKNKIREAKNAGAKIVYIPKIKSLSTSQIISIWQSERQP